VKPMTSTTITTTATTKKPTTVAMRQGLGKLHSPHSDYGHARAPLLEPTWTTPRPVHSHDTAQSTAANCSFRRRYVHVSFTSSTVAGTSSQMRAYFQNQRRLLRSTLRDAVDFAHRDRYGGVGRFPTSSHTRTRRCGPAEPFVRSVLLDAPFGCRLCTVVHPVGCLRAQRASGSSWTRCHQRRWRRRRGSATRRCRTS